MGQELDPTDVTPGEIVYRHLRGLIPLFLASKVIEESISFEKERENDDIYILSLVILRYLFFILGLIFAIVVIVTLVVGNFRIIYLLYSSSAGILGFSLADLMVRVDDDQELSGWRHTFLEMFISPVTSTSTRRIATLTVSTFILLALVILDLESVFPVIGF